MQDEGIIERISRHDAKGGQQTNYYDFEGLIQKMKPHALEALELRKKQTTETEILLNKKNAMSSPPKLTIVPPGGNK